MHEWKMSSDVNRVLSILRESPTIDVALSSFARIHHFTRDKALVEFTMAILNVQGELLKDDFSKLVQLDGKILKSFPETARKICKLGLNLLLQGNQDPEIKTMSQQLDSDPQIQNQFQALQYLDVLEPSMRLNREVFTSCLTLAQFPEINPPVLLEGIRNASPGSRIMLIQKIARMSPSIAPIITGVKFGLEALLHVIESISDDDRFNVITSATLLILPYNDSASRIAILKELFSV